MKDDYATAQGQNTNIQVDTEVKKLPDNSSNEASVRQAKKPDRSTTPNKAKEVDSVSDATHKTRQSKKSNASKGSKKGQRDIEHYEKDF